MLVDVFFCSAAVGEERRRIADRLFQMWRRVEGIALHVLTPARTKSNLDTFNRDRRIYAENWANGPVYLLVDDDCEVTTQDWLNKGLRLMNEYPQFAILSAWPDNAKILPWTPPDYAPIMDNRVLEHVSVGGFRFVRKHSMLAWPEATGPGYDRTQADFLREIGHRVGYMKHVRMTHHGEGKTELWRPPEPKEDAFGNALR